MFQKLFNTKPPPKWLTPYLDHKATSANRSTHWSNLRFVILDTETTGLSVKKDYPISIGAVAIESKAIVIKQSLEIILHQKEIIQNDAILIHGLLPNELAQGKEVKKALIDFLAFLNNSVIIAHHVAFDLAILTKSVRAFYPPFKFYNHRIDTAYLAMKIDGVHPQKQFVDRQQYTLDALCNRYNIEVIERHTAWGDAYTTALLFLKLVDILEQRESQLLWQLMPKRNWFLG